MKFLYAVILMGVFATTQILALGNCPPNETFVLFRNQCNRCDPPFLCLRYWLSGCECIKGYTRGDDGTCIPVSQCPGVTTATQATTTTQEASTTTSPMSTSGGTTSTTEGPTEGTTSTSEGTTSTTGGNMTPMK
ncbi:hypothetical protein TNCV_4550121 [Trichonephila clavipes]|nr:hypothetical protein TNCV_4550121 [Trichonephila clavipes]